MDELTLQEQLAAVLAKLDEIKTAVKKEYVTADEMVRDQLANEEEYQKYLDEKAATQAQEQEPQE